MVDTVRTWAALQTSLHDNTTGDILPQNLRDAILTALMYAGPFSGSIDFPTNQSYTVDFQATEAYTINKLFIQTVSGTCTVAIQINGVSVTGLSAVAVSSTLSQPTASGANSVAIGNNVTLVVSGATSPQNM